jgi:hypothetical protein
LLLFRNIEIFLQRTKSVYYRMRLKTLGFVLLMLGPVARGGSLEGGTLAGMVTATSTGEGIAGARIALDGTTMGAIADTGGRYSITGIPPGTYTVRVRVLGYRDFKADGIRINAGKVTRLPVRLDESIIPLREIQVTAGRMKREQDVRASVFTLAPTQTRTIPGVAEDVMRSLQAIPGVVSVNDFTAQMAVRGSGPDQNLIIMDDIEIFNPYQLYGLISIFNPETVSDINLITGGFPAKYGDRLSAVLDVTNREGDMHSPLHGSLNASITNANLVLHGGMPFGINGSYIVSARRTYYDLILGPIARETGLVSGDVAFPNFMDFQGKFVVEPAPAHRILANMLFSRDAVNIMSGPDRPTPDSVDVLDNTTNNVVGIAWHYFPSKEFYSKLSASWYRNRGDTQFGGEFIDPALDRMRFENRGDTTGIRLFNVAFNSSYNFGKVSIKEEAGWSLPGHLIEVGGGVDFLSTSLVWHFMPDETLRSILLQRGVAYVDDFVQSRDYVRTGVYVQDKIGLTGALSVQPGLRFDYYQIIGRAFLQPRLNISYALNPVTTLRGAWGIYRQSPGYEKLLDQQAFYDYSQAATSHLTAEQATHYVLGAERWLTEEWHLKVEGYYKKFDKVIVQEVVPGTVWKTYPIPGEDPLKQSGWTAPVAVSGDSLTTYPVNGATGQAYGIEFLLEKKNIGPDNRLSGWIGYALARADRVQGSITRPFQFDQRHTVDVVLEYHASSWFDIGVRWKYGSNFPYTPALGLTPRIVTVTQNGKSERVIETDANGNVVFDVDRDGESNKFTGQLPAYHRLDVRFTARTAFWGMDWTFYLDVINVYNHQNVLNYNYYQGDGYTVQRRAIGMLPIIPTLGFSAVF